MDDVEIGDISDKLTSIGVAGPLALQVLQSAGLPAGELKPGELAGRKLGRTRLYPGARPGGGAELVRAVAGSGQRGGVLEQAAGPAGAAPVGAEALEWQRILLGLPRVGVDTGARELVQETGQDYALHYAKGCYIGQEIVERVRARGEGARAALPG